MLHIVATHATAMLHIFLHAVGSYFTHFRKPCHAPLIPLQSRSIILQLQLFIRSSPLRRRIKPDWSHRPAVPGPGSDPVRPPYITRPKPETGCCCDSPSLPRRGWYVVRRGGVWLHRRLPCWGVVVESVSVFVAVVMTGSVVESVGMHRIRRFCKSCLVWQASGCRYIQPTSCFISD